MGRANAADSGESCDYQMMNALGGMHGEKDSFGIVGHDEYDGWGMVTGEG